MKLRKSWAMRLTSPTAAAGGPRVGEITIDGRVMDSQPWWGHDPGDTSAAAFRADLQALGLVEGDKLDLHISSLGGSLQSAMSIRSMLKDHPACTTAYISSVAASAATIIATGCDRTVMRAGTMQLIHFSADMPGYDEYMTAEDHIIAAENLQKWDGSMVAVYAQKTGKPEAEIRAQMEKGTWMSAEECKAFGLCDEIVDIDQPITATADEVNASIYSVGGRLFDFTGMAAPVAMLRVPAAEGDGEGEEETPPPATEEPDGEITARGRVTVAMIGARFPEIAQALREEGVQAERARNLELDAMLTETTSAMIVEARKAGTPAAEVSKGIVAAMIKSGKGAAFLAARSADAHVGGANGVAVGVVPDGNSPDDDYQAVVAAAKKNSELGRV